MSNERDPEVERERLLRQLFAHADPRPQPPRSDTEEVRRAVFAEWEAVTGPRVWRRRGAFAAATAAVLAATFLYVGGGSDRGVPAPLVARVEQVQGVVTTSDGARLVAGSGILAGTQLVAGGEGRIGLRLSGGGSLRIGPRSRVVLTGNDEAELLAGVLYFDSEDQRAGEFAVTTDLGMIRDVGTQFLARLDDEELEVSVREGRVDVTSGALSSTAGVGERLVASQTANDLRRDSVETFGSRWEWAEQLAPPFDIDGRTLGEFLEWFEEQTGRTVVFVDSTAEPALRGAVLTGSVELPPLQKLSAVLALNDLTYVLDGERVVIRRR